MAEHQAADRSEREERPPLLAAIDLGTTRVRVGILHPTPAALAVLAEQRAEVLHPEPGAARCRWSAYRAALEPLVRALADACRAEGATRLRIALTGQVSSLIRWRAGAAQPEEDTFPIWMDTTCAAAVPQVASWWSGGRDIAMLGTALPTATNWLAVKLAQERADRPQADPTLRYLQLQDAVFLHLTGSLWSHPSSQISCVDHRTGGYAPALLAALGITAAQLPPLDPHGQAPLRPALAQAYGLPAATTIHVAPHDTHCALLGMQPRPGDGVLLASTSEVIGVCEAAARAQAPARLVRVALDGRWFIYGSGSSGGATVDWLCRQLLRLPEADGLEALSAAAAALPPGAEGVTVLPYLAGERAPLWDASLTGTILGLRPHHTAAHLLRAVLEGVACARRQAVEAAECPLPARFLASGGGTVNALWNRIRAHVLDRPLAVLAERDTALLGALGTLAGPGGAAAQALQVLARHTLVTPVPAEAAAYQGVYLRYRELQHRVHALPPMSGTAHG